jgi:predicted lipoprotein with Yx(FWY)xxD motif
MRIVVALLAALALSLAACGGDDDDAPAGGEPAASGDEAAGGDQAAGGDGPGSNADKQEQGGPGITITTGSSQFGEILFDADQQAIYLFDKETSSKPDCYGDCAAAWPPVLTDGEPQAAGGIDSKLLGTTERDDGTTQVTYNGHPLYYYVDDGKGEVLCHNVSEFGGLWLVLDRSGDPLS